MKDKGGETVKHCDALKYLGVKHWGCSQELDHH